MGTFDEKLKTIPKIFNSVDEAYQTWVWLMHIGKAVRVGRNEGETINILCNIWKNVLLINGTPKEEYKIYDMILKDKKKLILYHHVQLGKALGIITKEEDIRDFEICDEMTEEDVKIIKKTMLEMKRMASLEEEYEIRIIEIDKNDYKIVKI